jgi:molybdate transport system substrate-binding protein
MFLLHKITTALLLPLLLLMAANGALAAQPRYSVTIYAAASLKDALDAVLRTRELQGHGAAKAIYGASSALARQIQQGAPADVFISADTDWMDYLAQRTLLRDGTRVHWLTNRLVLIAPASGKSPLAIAPKFPLAAALGNDRLAIADPDSVPAGRYAKASLQALGVWNEVARKLAPTDNVRAALMLVARGEVPFGIVYATDAAAEPRVRILGEFPAHTHPPILYPAAIVLHSRSADAPALLAFLRSGEARTIWRKFGFGIVQ